MPLCVTTLVNLAVTSGAERYEILLGIAALLTPWNDVVYLEPSKTPTALAVPAVPCEDDLS